MSKEGEDFQDDLSFSLSLPPPTPPPPIQGACQVSPVCLPLRGELEVGTFSRKWSFLFFVPIQGRCRKNFRGKALRRSPEARVGLPLSLSQVPPPILLQGSGGRTATLKVADTTVLRPDLWAVPAHAEPATHRERAVLQARVPETPPTSPCVNVCSASFLREAKGSLSSWGLWSHGKNSSNFIICFLVKAVFCVFFFNSF